MALVVKDRVQETTTTTGTGTITLAGAVTGFQSFSVIGNANTTYYTIAAGSEFEVGIGTYTALGTTLSRDTILESSNGGAAVNFSAGIKNVFVTYPAEKSLYLDASNNAIGLGTVATTTTLTNAVGLPLTTGVTGTLPIANGGTGTTSTTFTNLTTNVTGTLPVTNGGTGVATLTTAYGVLAAGTTATGALQNIGTGTTAQVLTSNGAGVLPSFQAAGGGFPSGTRMAFQQTAAPTGFTKDTTAAINDSMLRLVTGTVTSGGTTAFSTWSAVTATGATTLDTSQIPSHSHSGGVTGTAPLAHAENNVTNFAGNTGNTGGGGSHTHSLTRALKFYDFIIASKD